jgi:Domain of unknown function (DUF4281)
METLFKLSSLAVLPFWGLMIFLPRWRVTGRLLSSPLVSALPALCYTALVIPRFAEIWQAVSSPELPGIAALLATPLGAMIGWLHFLAFDLFVGRWIYLESRKRRITAWIISPVLFLTLMLGPCGFLLYLIVRRASGFLPKSENVIPVSTGSEQGD